MPDSKPEKAGLAALPRKWATVTQLVGTFGLAVFLVLYYVIVVQPREGKRLDELTGSVKELMERTNQNQTQLTRSQVTSLTELLVRATAGDIVDRFCAASEATDLAPQIESLIVERAAAFDGVQRRDGAALNMAFPQAARNGNAPKRLESVVRRTSGKPSEMYQACVQELRALLFLHAAAK